MIFHVFCKPLILNQDLSDDTTSTLNPDGWYYARDDWGNICAFVDSWQGCSDLHVIDVFGASMSMTRTWRRRHYRAEAWDIALNHKMDIVSKHGWYSLLLLALRLSLD